MSSAYSSQVDQERIVRILKAASDVQILRLQAHFRRRNQTAFGYTIFYAEESVKLCIKGDFESDVMIRAIALTLSTEEFVKIFSD